MKLLRAFAILAVLGLSATQAAAQDSLRFVTGNPYSNPTSWGARVGPYRGQMITEPGSPMVDMYCVDYLHLVTASKWEIDIRGLSGSLVGTYGWDRFGAGALDRYKQAAWLATKFQPGVNQGQWGAIHGTMWWVMSGGTATQWNNPAITVGPDQYWLDQLALGDWQNIDLSEWAVLTDTQGVQQEYLVRNVVPEPETFLLLGSGLIGLGFVAYRRRGGVA